MKNKANPKEAENAGLFVRPWQDSNAVILGSLTSPFTEIWNKVEPQFKYIADRVHLEVGSDMLDELPRKTRPVNSLFLWSLPELISEQYVRAVNIDDIVSDVLKNLYGSTWRSPMIITTEHSQFKYGFGITWLCAVPAHVGAI